MLPTYLVIGAAKCGTTSLCHNLGEHPDVFMSHPKEIHYFGRTDPKKTPPWYTSHFVRATGHQAVGEGSTSYTHPNIIDACVHEISELIPAVRLIYMVRNPLRRLESDWMMRRHEGWATESINEEVMRQATLISHGLYWRNLSVYRNYFPDEQILVVFLEDFTRDPAGELQRCLSHIGVDPDLVVGQPQDARNRSRDFRKDRWLARWIRHAGVASSVRELVPRPVVDLAKAMLTRPDRFDVQWDPAVRRYVLDELAEDSRRFLQHCGKPSDFWHHETVAVETVPTCRHDPSRDLTTTR